MNGVFATIRALSRVTAFIAVPLFLVIITIRKPDFASFVVYGKTAQILVISSLFVKPLSRILMNRLFTFIVSLRREIGVSAFWFFVFHATGMIYTFKLYNLQQYSDMTSNLFWGIPAAVGMIVLGLTSNNVSMRLLKRNWKTVQRIAYPTLFLILLHSSLAEHDLKKFVFFGSTYLLLKIGQWYVDSHRTSVSAVKPGS